MVRYPLLACCCLAVLLPAYPAAAETIEDVEKKIIESQGKLKSYTAKMKTKQDLDVGEGNRIKSDVEGAVEWMRKGDKVLYHSELKGSSVQTYAGKDMKNDVSSTMVSDGDFLYVMSDQMGQKMVVKQKYDPSVTGEAKTMFETLRREHALKLLPDEKVDGAEVYVIEATAKSADMQPINKTVLYFRKDNGLPVKTVGMDKKNQPVSSSATTDIKLNADIKPERFEFKAPEGVQVIDMSKGE